MIKNLLKSTALGLGTFLALSAPQQASAVEMVIQAERGALVAPMRAGTVDGRGIIESIVTNYEGAGTGKATYTFTAPTAGTYTFFVTAMGHGELYNSIFVQVNGGAWITKQFGLEATPPSAYNAFKEYQVATATLNAGQHTFVIRGREKFAKIDSIRISGGGSTSPTPPPTTTVYTTPKIGAVDYSWDESQARIDAIAKFDFALIDKGRQHAGPSGRLARFTTAVKNKNPNIKLAHYEIHMELLCNVASDNTSNNALIAAANQSNVWLRKANGNRAQWTTAYNACDINLSPWAPLVNGQSWARYKAQQDINSYFYAGSKLDYIYMDNIFHQPRSTADWYRNGRDVSPATVAQPYRVAYMQYYDYFRANKTNVKVMANTDNNLDSAEYRNKLSGAHLENAMAESGSYVNWALDRVLGYSGMMARYTAVMNNTVAPKDVMFQIFGSPNNYRLMRYGLATSMMNNGYFVYVNQVYNAMPPWFDEYDVQIGVPIDPPQTAAKANGVWLRKYANGLVLVNPTNGTLSVNVGPGYKRFSGRQDPGVNNGQVQAVVTLPAKTGLLMVKQ